MGRNGLDNGWIQFNHVKVPHENLLCKYAQVDVETGKYTPPKRSESKAAYGALIMGRQSMIKDSANVMKLALTVAVRYGAVRKQGNPDKHGVETTLLDYQTHQYKLMPLLACTYAINYTAQFMFKLYKTMEEGLSSGDSSALPDVHATSAGLKSFSTWCAHYAIDTCRQSCGGHGYSAYTGLSSLFNDFAVNCTWEGDNTVLAQQTTRYLLGVCKRVGEKEVITGPVSYLSILPPPTFKLPEAVKGPVYHYVNNDAAMESLCDTVHPHSLTCCPLHFK